MYYSHPLKNLKDDKFVTIQEIPLDSSDTRPQQISRPQRSFGSYIRGWVWRVFPWIGEPPPQQLDNLHKQPSFPWLGLLSLLTALCSLGLSLIVLSRFNHDAQADTKYLKPASYLSAIISLNSIVLHIALAEGVTTAWWYRAARSDVTLQQLHEIYAMGTSTLSVLLSGKSFNYVAMGTLFVATIPLNGFLLQNALTMVPGTCNNNTDLSIPLVPRLPLGFSGKVENHTLDSLSDALTTITSSMDGMTNLPAGAFYPYSYSDFGSIGCTNEKNTSVCTRNFTLTGFNMSCTLDWNQTYDLRPTSLPKVPKYTTTVFSSQVLWNLSTPNSIYLEMLSKPGQKCQGKFLRKTCELKAANMIFPVQVNSDAGYYPGSDLREHSANNQAFPIITLDAWAQVSNISFESQLEPYSNEGEENSTFGGIAKWLGNRFNSKIEWIYKNGSWDTNSTGPMAQTYRIWPYRLPENLSDPYPYEKSFDPSHNDEKWCENVYSGQDIATELGYWGELLSQPSSLSPTNMIFVTLNQVMLGASVSLAATQAEQSWEKWNVDNTTNISTREEYYKDQFGYELYMNTTGALQSQSCLRYDVRWGYYSASVAITVVIVLMVTPLFYGFWTLDRRGTLNPFETAAAFGAPALQDADMRKGTEVLLKEIGQRPAHFAASAVALPPPPSSPQQTTYPMVK